MKKNKFMRLASVLLVAVLLSTCAISGTFAKYTTTTSGTDTARVAYWGFNQTAAQTFDLFDGTYTNVDSQDDVNVIAPGTEKSTTLVFQYTDNANGEGNDITAPEVAYNFEIAFVATGDYDSLDANNNFKWTLQMPGATSATQYNTVAALETAIEALNKTGNQTYAAGSLPTGFDAGANTITIGWVWTFSADNDGDVADTAMGNAATLENVTFTITITATQVN